MSVVSPFMEVSYASIKNSLDIGHGVSLGEGVRMSFTEYMANSRAGDDLH